MHVVTEVDPDDRHAPGAQRLPRRLRRPRGLRRRRPAAQDSHRRPCRVLGPSRLACSLRRRWHGSVCPVPRARPSIRAPPSRPRSTSIPAAEIQIVFLLGEAEGIDAARDLIRRYSRDGRARRRFGRRSRSVGCLLETVQVRTPEPALDLLINRWLLYQVLELPRLGPVGVLPVGRGLRVSRPAPRRDGARSTRHPKRREPISCARRAGSFPRETCSTGGTLPLGAVFVRGSPTILSGCRLSPRAT